MKNPIYVYDTTTEGQPIVCIGHGNGFSAELYTPLAAALGTDFHRVCLPARPWWGDEDPQEFDSWQRLADDFVEGIKQHHLAPVVGVGHSMSGVTMTMAAIKNPELFRAIVLIDPVFVPRWATRILRIYKLFGRQINAGMAQRALKRRRTWESVDEAYQRFRSRSLFDGCSDEIVRIYVESMTRPNGQGIELIYSPEWEARIFSRLPLDEWKFPPKIQIPCLVLGGAKTDVFMESSVHLWRRMRPDIPVVMIPETGHLLPMQKPDVVARHIQDFLAGIANR